MSEERQQQIEPLLPQCEKFNALAKNITNVNRVLPIMALRAALMNEKLLVRYSTWTPKASTTKKKIILTTYAAGVPKVSETSSQHIAVLSHGTWYTISTKI